MATLSKYVVDLDGGKPTFVAATAGGDDFINSGKDFLVVKNGGAGNINVTIDSVALCSYGFDHNLTVAVAASGEEWIGPFPKARFNDENGKVNVTYSGVTSVTVAVVELP
ncbi:MAG: hypothetical protein C4589_11285 [Peptococcaceae bacterium]|jgi:hypothetical protein|nr:MAG: hypothetical protein C4589_11285 [Peptococcaceae bacterium]